MTIADFIRDVDPTDPDAVLAALNDAAHEAVGGENWDEPCRHGHFDCSHRDGGPCHNELTSAKIGSLVGWSVAAGAALDAR